MAKQSINIGTTANDKKGDSLRAAFQKVNANFTELYSIGFKGWTFKTSNYTAQNGDRIIANTSAGPFTITLPSNPQQGYFVEIADGWNFAINNLTLVSTKPVEGFDEDIVINLQGLSLEFVYVNTSWQILTTLGVKGDKGDPGEGFVLGSNYNINIIGDDSSTIVNAATNKITAGTAELGNIEITGSTVGTTDSSAITIDQAVNLNSDVTVGGDILPSVANGGDLGSAAKPWKSLYVSGSTIYIGGNALGINDQGELTYNDNRVAHEAGEFMTLDNLSNVNSSNPSNGDVLTWAGSFWTHTTLASIGNLRVDSSAGATTIGTIDNPNTGGWGGYDLYIDSGFNSDAFIYIPGLASQAGSTNLQISNNSAAGSIQLFGRGGVQAVVNHGVNEKVFEFADNGTLIFPDGSLALTDSVLANGLDADIKGSVFGDDSTILVDGVSGVLRANVNVANTWTVTTGDKTWSFIYGDVSLGTNPIFEFPGSLQAVGSQTAIYAPADDLSGNWGMSIDAANSPYYVDIGEISGSNYWRFDDNGSITFPDATVQTTAYTGLQTSLVGAVDNNVLIRTSETIVTNNLYNNTTDFVTDIDPGLGYPIGGWSQRNETEIEVNLFVPGLGSFYTFLTGLALGRTVVVTYSTAGGNQTFTSTVSQIFSGIAQFDPVTGWQRTSGRILGTLPVGQTGIVSINFPVTTTPQRDWTFSDTGKLTVPGIIELSNGAQIFNTAGVDDSITIGATGTPGTTTFNGSGFFNDDTFFHKAIQEKFSSLQDATGVVTHNCANGHIFYHTSPDANWTVNLTNFSLVTNYATAITIIISQGGTGYYPSALQIGGAAQTINWQGNTTPTPSSNRVDVVTFSIFLSGSGYTVLGQLTGF